MKEIQAKYSRYLENEFDGLNEKQIEEVREIIEIGSRIDLWQIELPDRIKKEGEGRESRGFSKANVGPFEISGVLKDFVDLENECDESNNRYTIYQTLKISKILKNNGVNLGKLKLTKQKNGKTEYLNLEEIEQQGIDIKRIIKNNRLQAEYPIRNETI